jgi:hypothetical protein
MRRVEAWLAALPLITAVACSEKLPAEQPKIHTEGQRSDALTVPTFVQVASATPQSPMTTVTATFAAAQTAGNLNVIAVGWNDTTASVTSVTDAAGNTYARAIGPTTSPGPLSQSIYYAKNIKAAAAGTNVVTVTFSPAAAWVDLRILEYSGMDSNNPLDGSVGASGTSGTADSGALTTTNANDLLFGANMTTITTLGPGTGFVSRIITVPDSDLAEDRMVSTTGTYHATASVSTGGAWVMQLVAFRGGPADTQPPSAPPSLNATAPTSASINLSWGAATDNVGVSGYLIERCQGTGCTSFAQIAAPPGVGTTFSDTGLPPSTSFQYRVRATDAAGNIGPYSPTASATTLPDSTPPTAPSGLTASPVGSTQINLSWNASTDDVGVTGYLIERCQGSGCNAFLQIAAPAGTATTYGDLGLPTGTSFSYRVRATDAAGNLSPYSGVASAMTPMVDTQPPTAPASLSATAISNSQVNLSWAASTDNVGVTGYLVERCQDSGCTGFAQIAVTGGTTTTFGDSGLASATSYSYRVRATDGAANLGGYSPVATTTTQSNPPPPTIPSYVQGAFATPQSSKSSLAVAYPGAQGAGDLNVVVVGWNDTTSQVASVTDSKGNVYSRAIGPTQRSGQVSQSIYYAANIAPAAAGGNSVTVTFSAPAAYVDLRVMEYAGVVRSNPLDVAVAASGASISPSSGSLTTTTAGDLLVAANTVTTGNVAAGPGYTLRTITTPDMDLVEDRIATNTGSYSASASLDVSGGWVMQLVAFKPAPADTTPPTVSITSPAGGATLGGTASVSVSAADPESGVQAVQLLVDGLLLQSAAGATASFAVDTTEFANGSHQLSATATNGSKLVGTSSPVTVSFNNASPGNPAVSGLWSGTTTLPLVATHTSQLPGGKILTSDAQNTWGANAWTWDPSSNTFTSVPVPANIFCSAHEQMADGRIFVAGGHANAAHVGLPVANAFDPVTQSWTVLPDMANPRWYPTATTLPDGRELVLVGENNCDNCDVVTPEIYNPSTNSWTSIPQANFFFTYYPHVFVLPDGRVLVSSTAESPTASQILNLSSLSWTAVGGPAVEGGTAAMYRPGKVIKTGTSVDPDTAVRNSTATTYVLDTTVASPTWRQVGAMVFPRTYATLTLLPDGTVLATGGGPTTAATNTANAILPAEVWSPSSEAWSRLAPMHAPRLYHSEALLMPDGRVLVLGGGRFDDATVPTDQFSAEFFLPPYLFKGPRPVISSAPGRLTLGSQFTVQTPDAARIASVVLMRFASVTHGINMAQRYVALSFTTGSGSLTVTAPASYNLATPGNYMLFLVDTNGVPSVAAEVRL